MQLSFGVILKTWRQTNSGPLIPSEGFLVSSLRSDLCLRAQVEEHSGSRFGRLADPRKIEGMTAAWAGLLGSLLTHTFRSRPLNLVDNYRLLP